MFYCKIDGETELRQLEEPHAQELFELVDGNRDHLRRWLPWVDAMQAAEDEKRFIADAGEWYRKNGTITAGIWHSGRLAGSIGLVGLDLANRNVKIGYWIGREYQGRGLATLACRAVVNTAFEDLGLKRVEIQAAAENYRSRAVPERLGFKLEGVSRQSTWLYDHFQDMAIYSVLSEEWPRQQALP